MGGGYDKSGALAGSDDGNINHDALVSQPADRPPVRNSPTAGTQHRCVPIQSATERDERQTGPP